MKVFAILGAKIGFLWSKKQDGFTHPPILRFDFDVENGEGLINERR